MHNTGTSTPFAYHFTASCCFNYRWQNLPASNQLRGFHHNINIEASDRRRAVSSTDMHVQCRSDGGCGGGRLSRCSDPRVQRKFWNSAHAESSILVQFALHLTYFILHIKRTQVVWHSVFASLSSTPLIRMVVDSLYKLYSESTTNPQQIHNKLNK
jgi:hypothetical protein